MSVPPSFNEKCLLYIYDLWFCPYLFVSSLRTCACFVVNFLGGKEKEPENEKVTENDDGKNTTTNTFLCQINNNSNGHNNNNNNNGNVDDNNSIWKQFLINNHSFICDRLKLIPHVVKSPWYLPIPNKPVLLGKYSPSRTYRGENYLEVDIEADSTNLAQKVVKGAHGVSKQIIVDIVWVIEGCKAAELPERCLGGVRLFNVDVTKVTPLKKWDDVAFTKNSSAADETEESESDNAAQEEVEVDDNMGVD
ncbi:hypothetical protein RFI_00950 [Reticulomyxa filosa]|uniref:Protein ENHANCED DISEASE RESISTANCE 2 C-terminal domain-containing protein n=1 Tax=Reticulomyxa filosa TaxID=46433 RepID=X6PDC8_RETFI|nr:hypothetical protein RFI_00950 [Reticulomyxa filosa]|eukprot:ETO36113.1 hypothetical protein RFI_00950 [Reticulomyxa filosa]